MSIFSNKKTSKEPLWDRLPVIPVRENIRSKYVPMSGMNGDHLPKLRGIERPEYSDPARHFENIRRTDTRRNVNILYRHHQYVMTRIVRDQDDMYKKLCEVHRDKRRMQRRRLQRQREELRVKVRSQMMKGLPIADRKQDEDFRRNDISQDKSRPSSQNVITSVQDGEAPIHDDKNAYRAEDGVPTDRHEHEPEVENQQTELYDPPQQEHIQDGLFRSRKSRVLEVGKESSAPVTRTKCFELNETRAEIETEVVEDAEFQSQKSPESEINDDDIEADDQIRSLDEVSDLMKKARPSVTNGRRTSMFTVPEDVPDYGWFTVGLVDIPTGKTDDYRLTPVDTLSSDDDVPEDCEIQEIPNARRRRTGVVAPPSDIQRDPERTEHAKTDSVHRNRSPDRVLLVDVREGEEGETCILEVSGSRYSVVGNPDLDSVDIGSRTFVPVSSASKSIIKTNSSKSLKSVSKSVSLPAISPKTVQPKVRATQHFSANMLWVLKQEEKTRRQWQLHMTGEDDHVVKYYRGKDGSLVPMPFERKTYFTPLSMKERYRQKKLLAGEKVKATDHRDRVDRFCKAPDPLAGPFTWEWRNTYVPETEMTSSDLKG